MRVILSKVHARNRGAAAIFTQPIDFYTWICHFRSTCPVPEYSHNSLYRLTIRGRQEGNRHIPATGGTMWYLKGRADFPEVTDGDWPSPLLPVQRVLMLFRPIRGGGPFSENRRRPRKGSFIPQGKKPWGPTPCQLCSNCAVDRRKQPVLDGTTGRRGGGDFPTRTRTWRASTASSGPHSSLNKGLRRNGRFPIRLDTNEVAIHGHCPVEVRRLVPHGHPIRPLAYPQKAVIAP